MEICTNNEAPGIESTVLCVIGADCHRARVRMLRCADRTQGMLPHPFAVEMFRKPDRWVCVDMTAQTPLEAVRAAMDLLACSLDDRVQQFHPEVTGWPTFVATYAERPVVSPEAGTVPVSQFELNRLHSCEKAWVACYEELRDGNSRGWFTAPGLTGKESVLLEIRRLQAIERQHK